MTKLLMLGIGLLAASTGRAQQLQGGFITNSQKGTVYFSNDYYWLSQGRFKHSGDGCTGPYFGNGTYQIVGDSLVLRYDAWSPTPAAATLDTTTSQLGGVHVMVQVYGATTQQPIAGATLGLAGSKLGGITDGAGRGWLTLLPKAGDSLIASALGYSKLKFALRPNSPQRWTVMLAPERGRIRGNTRLSFSLATWSNQFRVATWFENRNRLALYERQMQAP